MKATHYFAVSILTVFSMGLIAAGAYRFATPAHAAPGSLTIDPKEIRFEGKVDQIILVPIVLTNHGDSPIRVVGSEDICGAEGCMTALDPLVDIPPKSPTTVSIELKPFKPGLFDRSITLFTDHPLFPRVTVRASGWINSSIAALPPGKFELTISYNGNT